LREDRHPDAMMPEAGNDKNATVERGSFVAVHLVEDGPDQRFAATQ
jgi:hypothetical protein